MTQAKLDPFAPPVKPARRRVSRVFVAMIVLAVLGAGVAGFGVFGLIGYRAFSLAPNTTMGDTLKGASTVLTVAPGSEGLHRGDMIVFDLGALPDAAGQSGSILKRVIGVGGDTVVCCDERQHTQVNGKSVVEPYIAVPQFASDAAGFRYSVKVPAGTVFVAGDQRDNSRDSRIYADAPGGGSIPVSKVYGVVVATGSVLTPRPLTPTTAFTDAGLEGAPRTDEGYLLDRALILAGLVLLLTGIIGAVVSLARSGGKRRLPAVR